MSTAWQRSQETKLQHITELSETNRPSSYTMRTRKNYKLIALLLGDKISASVIFSLRHRCPTKRVLFPFTCVRNTCCFDTWVAKYFRNTCRNECRYLRSVHYCCTILVTQPWIKFYANLFGCYRVSTCGHANMINVYAHFFAISSTNV